MIGSLVSLYTGVLFIPNVSASLHRKEDIWLIQEAGLIPSSEWVKIPKGRISEVISGGSQGRAHSLWYSSFSAPLNLPNKGALEGTTCVFFFVSSRSITSISREGRYLPKPFKAVGKILRTPFVQGFLLSFFSILSPPTMMDI